MGLETPDEYQPLDNGGYLSEQTPFDTLFNCQSANQDAGFEALMQQAEEKGLYLAVFRSWNQVVREPCVLGKQNKAIYDKYARLSATTWRFVPRDLVPADYFE